MQNIMIYGTSSGVGKSLFAAGLCRILAQDGLNAAPFKAINISLNSGVTKNQEEIATSQIVQALCANIDPQAIMNPFLIKPQKGRYPQIIIKGKVATKAQIEKYYEDKSGLWSVIKQSYDLLSKQYTHIVLEGAGSPAEIPFIKNDVVNLKIAQYANTPIILVADMSQGGAFAALEGTISILNRYKPNIAQKIQGIVLNKYQGDKKTLQKTIKDFTQAIKIPILGIIPFMENHGIADEDTWNLSDTSILKKEALLDIVIIRTPSLQNSHDFDPLIQETDVQVRFISDKKDFKNPDLVILAGSKNTVLDLEWMQKNGLADCILKHAQKNKAIIGICGGYQMLGRSIVDPQNIESNKKAIKGLGLLEAKTEFQNTKTAKQVSGEIIANTGILAHAAGILISGYEIHMGKTTVEGQNLADLKQNRDGIVGNNGLIFGTYIHDIFKNNNFRHVILKNLASKKGVKLKHLNNFDSENNFDQLAKTIRENIDLKLMYKILNQKGRYVS